MIVLRIHGDELMFGGSGTVMTHSPRIPQMEMMKVHIPFTFKLHESFKSTYTGEFSPKYIPLISLFFQDFWENPRSQFFFRINANRKLKIDILFQRRIRNN